MARHLAEISQRASLAEHALEMLAVRQMIEDIPIHPSTITAGGDTDHPVHTVRVPEYAD
jgi:hypothetical protein